MPGGLGYTYPNPMQLQDKLWLFWRGGAWNPTFSYTTDGIHWVPARELVYFGHAQRPYTKYVTDGKRQIHGIFTDGHPENWKNSLHYARYENEALYAMDGRKLGTLKDVPLHTSKLDHIYNYSDAGGRAWGHDIALTADGRPRVVYTRRVNNRDTFWYAYHNGTKWLSRKIVEAGAGRPSFHSGGATLDHEDPRVVYLSRTIGNWNQVEQWFTPGLGPHVDAPPADQRPLGLRHPPGHPARARAGRQPDPLRLGRPAHDRLHQLHDARPRAGFLRPCRSATGARLRRRAQRLRRLCRLRHPSRAAQPLVASSSCRRSWAASSIVLVAPLGGAVVARDQAHPVDAAEVAVDERVARLGLVGRPVGEPEVPGGVLVPRVRLEERVLVGRPRLDRRPTRCRGRTGARR